MSLLLVQVNAASRVPLFELAEWSDFANFAPKGAKWVAIEFGGTPLEDFEHPPNAVYLLLGLGLGLVSLSALGFGLGLYRARVLVTLTLTLSLTRCTCSAPRTSGYPPPCCAASMSESVGSGHALGSGSTTPYLGADALPVERAGARATS